jgi:hypothetical protein
VVKGGHTAKVVEGGRKEKLLVNIRDATIADDDGIRCESVSRRERQTLFL